MFSMLFRFSTESRSIKIILVFFVFTILVLSALFKGEQTSWDTNNYVFIFNEYYPDSLIYYFSHVGDYEFEKGFSILIVLLKTLDIKYDVFFMLVTLISVFCVFFSIKRDSIDVFMSAFLYIFCFYFRNEVVIIRFGLSSALFILSLSFLNSSDNKKALLFGVLSFSMHYTGIISVLIFIFNRIKFTRNIYILLVPAFIIGVFFPPLKLLSGLLSTFPELSVIGFDRIVRYLGVESSAGLKGMALYIPFVYFAYIYHDYLYKNFKPYLLSFIMMLFCILVFNEVSTLSRLYLFFSMSIIILFPSLCKHLKALQAGGDRILYSYIIIFCLYVFFRQNFFNSGGSINFY